MENTYQNIMKYLFTSTRMAEIENTDNKGVLVKLYRNLNLHTLLMGMQNVGKLVENRLMAAQKI